MEAAHYIHDFYGDALIRDPQPHYAAMREAGPVVWLEQNQCYAVAQYVAQDTQVAGVAIKRRGKDYRDICIGQPRSAGLE